MNNDLIKRIDDWLPYADEESGILASLLRDCRAEIVNLKEVNANLSNLTLEYELEIERLSKPYVPMTDDDWCEAIDGETRLFHGANIGFCKIVERIVIKRARGQK